MVSYEDAYNVNSDNTEQLYGSYGTFIYKDNYIHVKNIRLHVLPMTAIYVVVSYILHKGLSGILFHMM